MSIFEMLANCVGVATLYATPVVDTYENIEDITIEKLNLNNAIGFGTNLILQNILHQSYGISIRDIIPTEWIETTENCVINLSPILKNFDISESKILDNNTDVDVMDYIYDKYQIDNWSDFIDTIYKNIRQVIYTGQTKDSKNFQFNIDDKTNKMIGTLACTLARYNINFSDIKIGEDTIINVPFDTTRLDELEDYIWEWLSTKGYLSQNITRNLWHFPQDFYNIFTDSPLNSDGFFKYCHFSIKYDNTSKSWMCAFYITGVEIDHLRWTGSLGTAWQKCTAKYTVVCIDKDGFTVDKSNLFGMIGARDNERWCVFAHESEFSTFDGATWNSSLTQPQTLWCHRTNCDLIINDQTVHYDSVVYDRNATNHISGNNPYLGGWVTLPYDSGGDWQCFADVNYGNNTGWNVYRYDQPNVSWTLPTYTERYVTQFEDDSTQVDVMINNVITDGTIKLKTPVVDTITKDNLDDNDIELQNDNIGSFLHIFVNLATLSLGLISSLTPFDTTHKLKVATIDRRNKRLLDKHIPVTQFIPTARAEYMPLWNNALRLADIQPPPKVGLCMLYHLTDDNLIQLANDLWNLPIPQSITERDPFEALTKLFALPFELTAGRDYKAYAKSENENQAIGFNEEGQVPILFGDNYAHTAYGYPLTGYRKNIWFDRIPIVLNNNFTDYYAKASIWLPFIGYRDLDISLVVNQQLRCIYTIDLNTGDFIVRLYSQNSTSGTLVLTGGEISEDVYNIEDNETNQVEGDNEEAYDIDFSTNYGSPILYEHGNMAYTMQLASKYTNGLEIFQGMKQVMSNLTSAIASFATGNVGGAVAGGINAIVSGIDTGITAKRGNPIESKGAIGGSNWFGHCRPYITVYRHQPIADMNEKGTAFDETIGHKSSYGLRIKDMEPGFHKIKSIKLELKATLKEMEMIKKILMDGFYYGNSKKRKKV